jgi:hypothetical protein
LCPASTTTPVAKHRARVLKINFFDFSPITEVEPMA